MERAVRVAAEGAAEHRLDCVELATVRLSDPSAAWLLTEISLHSLLVVADVESWKPKRDGRRVLQRAIVSVDANEIVEAEML